MGPLPELTSAEREADGGMGVVVGAGAGAVGVGTSVDETWATEVGADDAEVVGAVASPGIIKADMRTPTTPYFHQLTMTNRSRPIPAPQQFPADK